MGGGEVPTRYKACTRLVTGGGGVPPPPVTNREFGLTTIDYKDTVENLRKVEVKFSWV